MILNKDIIHFDRIPELKKSKTVLDAFDVKQPKLLTFRYLLDMILC